RVSIGRRTSHMLGADERAGTGPVVDDDGLAERPGEWLRDRACERVGDAARGKRRNETNRLGGKCIGPGVAREPKPRSNDERVCAKTHGVTSQEFAMAARCA